MDQAYEATYHQLEEQHWWFASRRDMVFDIIRSLQLPLEASILEIGCSGGPLLLALQAAGYKHLQGIDVSERGIALAKERGLTEVALMDGAHLTFPDDSFDLVIASDVLEHIKEDTQALREWRRVLRPGGRLLVFVPAHPYLWSRHDEVNHHFRRYTAKALRTVITRADLRVERLAFWNFTLFFPTAILRLLQRVLPKPASPTTGDLIHVPTFINKGLLWLIESENHLLQFVDFPIGVSVFALTRKPQSKGVVNK